MATCLLGTEFNGLPTLLDNVMDEDITSQLPPRGGETSAGPVKLGA